MGKALIRRREGRANRRAHGPSARGGLGTGSPTASGGLGAGGRGAGRGKHRIMVECFKFGIRPDERVDKRRGFIHRSMNVG